MKIGNVVALVVVLAFGSIAVAQESCSNCPSSKSTVSTQKSCSGCPSSDTSTVSTDEKSCSGCSSATSVAVATDEKTCSECPVAAAMKNLPKMTYKVGEESTCCSKSAAEMAKKENKPMQFVVGEKTFDEKEQAYTALVTATESFVNEFTTSSKCEKSGKTSIAGKSCNCPVQAGKNAELVKTAVDKVKMSYVVGEEKCNCPMKAKELAAKSDDAKTTYVVNGEETCCSLEARMKLATAKYAAAVKAMASVEKKAEAAEATTKTTGT